MTRPQFTLTALLLIFFVSPILAQRKTYVGGELSVANDLYKVTDDGGYLLNVPLINGVGGLNVRQEINKNLFVETGLIFKYYQQGLGFKTMPYYGTSSGDPSLIIPLRFGLNVGLYKKKIYFVPVVGYSFVINQLYGYGYGYDYSPGYGSWDGHQTSATTTIDYHVEDYYDLSRYFSLLQTGIGFEFVLFRTLLLSISANYYSGFNKTYHEDITYTVNNSDPMYGTMVSKGQFWCVGTGLRYPISNFWAKEEKQMGD